MAYINNFLVLRVINIVNNASVVLQIVTKIHQNLYWHYGDVTINFVGTLTEMLRTPYEYVTEGAKVLLSMFNYV